jgi:PAS/PAC sensor hybrid histidine kinase (EC 2.7.13.3)
MAEQEKVSILGVDDQKENLLALEAIFAGSDINLVTVSSGQEALKQILHTEFAVILLDAFMPEMDGFETAKIIHSREKSKATPHNLF